jgi:hypothetical protein
MLRTFFATAAALILTLSASTAFGMHAEENREAVLKIVTQIQRADYEGDRAALKRLFAELAPYIADAQLGSRVQYWRGFALWRRSLNGFNEAADPKELEEDLDQAVVEFDGAAAKDPAFVDAKFSAGSCLMNLMYLNQKNPQRVQVLMERAIPLFAEAQKAAPENPRLLWVLGANYWYYSPQKNGPDQARAFQTYQAGLELARKARGTTIDPLDPSWGEPEMLMNLAWANLHAEAPNLVAAERYAHAALELVPYWHYVRDILIPQIRDAKAKAN